MSRESDDCDTPRPVAELLIDIRSADRAVQGRAFEELSRRTAGPVEWAYSAWDGLVAGLADKDNHVRAISAQLLCGLAKSDPEHRIVGDLGALVALTADPRFVTARHCLQSLWKVGVVDIARPAYLEALSARFAGCREEKNWSLLRADIIVSLRRVHDDTGDESVRTIALHLIATEDDPKYRKKYAALWR